MRVPFHLLALPRGLLLALRSCVFRSASGFSRLMSQSRPVLGSRKSTMGMRAVGRGFTWDTTDTQTDRRRQDQRQLVQLLQGAEEPVKCWDREVTCCCCCSLPRTHLPLSCPVR